MMTLADRERIEKRGRLAAQIRTLKEKETNIKKQLMTARGHYRDDLIQGLHKTGQKINRLEKQYKRLADKCATF